MVNFFFMYFLVRMKWLQYIIHVLALVGPNYHRIAQERHNGGRYVTLSSFRTARAH